MYTIVIPTDFSATSLKALNMGVYLAKQTHGTLYLVNYYGVLLPNLSVPEVPVPIDMMDDIRIAAEEQMKKLAASVSTDGFTLKTVVEMGHIKEDLLPLADQLQADILMMGTVGNGTIINKLIGSNASHVMEKSKFPILLVPADYEFNSLEQAVFADDFSSDNSRVIGQLVDFAFISGLKKIDIVHFNSTDNDQSASKGEAFDRLKNIFGEKNIHIKIISAPYMEKGIKDYLNQNKTDLVIMATEKKSLLQRLFVYGHTQIMAMHTHIPLLVYHRN